MCAILIALATWGAFALGLVAAQLAGGATIVPVVVLALGSLKSASSSTPVWGAWAAFASAAVVNFVSTQGLSIHRLGWTLVSLLAHLSFGWRLVSARRLSAVDRDVHDHLRVRERP